MSKSSDEYKRIKEKNKKKLARMLSRASDTDFLQMIWSVLALKSDQSSIRKEGLGWFSGYTKESVDRIINSPQHIFEWQFETLLNLLFATSKDFKPFGHRQRVLDCRNLTTVFQAMTLLREIENAEDMLDIAEFNILSHMHRIGQRQFPWQIGWLNRRNFHKSNVIYAGPKAKAQFCSKYNITMDDFRLTCFAIFTRFATNPQMKRNVDFTSIGISKRTYDISLSILCSPLDEAKKLAKKFARDGNHSAYKRSILRQTPIIIENNILYSPLPELIISRITDGLYYDVISKEDGKTNKSVNNEIGCNFEKYCINVLREYLDGIILIEEIQYNSNHTPDIMLSFNDGVEIVIECKATKQRVFAKLGLDLADSDHASQGIDQLARGVYQIWKFFSHSRRSLSVKIPKVSGSAFGVLLTLDTWIEGSFGRVSEILKRAHILADSEREEIEGIDRRPIAFCHIDELEILLTKTSDHGFVETLRRATSEDRQGWSLDGLVQEIDNHQYLKTKQAPNFSHEDCMPWKPKFKNYRELDVQ